MPNMDALNGGKALQAGILGSFDDLDAPWLISSYQVRVILHRDMAITCWYRCSADYCRGGTAIHWQGYVQLFSRSVELALCQYRFIAHILVGNVRQLKQTIALQFIFPSQSQLEYACRVIVLKGFAQSKKRPTKDVSAMPDAPPNTTVRRLLQLMLPQATLIMLLRLCNAISALMETLQC